jgi:hypothetical protein
VHDAAAAPEDADGEGELPAPPPRPPGPRVPLQVGELRVYFGNLHSHTGYSDGTGTPAEAFTYARDVADLDFLAVTEHNHATADTGAPADRRNGVLIAHRPELYAGGSDSLVAAAAAATEPGRFVALYGQEFSTISSGNHVNVFDVPQVIDAPSGAFDVFLALWLPAYPPPETRTTTTAPGAPSPRRAPASSPRHSPRPICSARSRPATSSPRWIATSPSSPTHTSADAPT